MKITLIGFDVELSGKRVISAGMATLDEEGNRYVECFRMEAVKTPVDVDGVDQIHGITGKDIADYRDFTKEKWKWWQQRLSVLRAQLNQEGSVGNNPKIWRHLREQFDAKVQEAVARGAHVRVVSDNAGVDLGVINEHLKAAYDGDWSRTLDYLQLKPNTDRVHSFVCDARTPKWLRHSSVRLLHHAPVMVPGVRLVKHYAPHDALLALCEYMGFVRSYPFVEPH